MFAGLTKPLQQCMNSLTAMHELFKQVLTNKDLSKAGELFSLEDNDIKDDLTEVLDRICEIAKSHDYALSDNDQSVVEICITRVTSAIRYARFSLPFLVANCKPNDKILNFFITKAFADDELKMALTVRAKSVTKKQINNCKAEI